ncbi:MAG: hypothetical protein ACOH1J_02585 [Microbacteriaceae bacterium]
MLTVDSARGPVLGSELEPIAVGRSIGVRETAFLGNAISPDGIRDCALLPGAEYHQIEIALDLRLDQSRSGFTVIDTDPATGIVVTIRPEPILFL